MTPANADTVRPARVTFAGRTYAVGSGETLLDALNGAGADIPSSCLSGACHTCLLQSVEGDPGAKAAAGLKDTQVAAGYFLACQARPTEDLTIATPAEAVPTPAVLISAEPLGASVLRVSVRPESPIAFRPGQHLTLRRDNGVARAYSIANLPVEAATVGLEFHVRLWPGGRMSPWLATAPAGSTLRLYGPAGSCCYVSSYQERPLLLVGTGTGVAPLIAVLRDAVAQGHRGPITIVYGARERAGLYQDGGLSDLAARHPQVTYRRALASDDQDIEVAARQASGEFRAGPARVAAYVCGDPDTVHRIRRGLFLDGMSLRTIHADAFEHPPG